MSIDAILTTSFEHAQTAEDFCVRAGLFTAFVDVSITADDLTDVIEILRARKEFAESDRLRTLQARLRAVYDPYRLLICRPRSIEAKTQKEGVA